MHSGLNIKGGAERVCISLIEALNEIGVVPHLYTERSINDDAIAQYYGKKIFFKKYSLLPFDLHTFGRYVPIIAGLRSSFLAN